jgi:ubiquinol oxidase
LEEQAVVTYSHILEEIDKGNLPMWKALPAPPLAVDYWRLPKEAMMRDVILAIRSLSH